MAVINLQSINDSLIYKFSSESELKQTIHKLSENFTSNREDLSEYLKSPKMVAAYSCFYLLTNIPKLNSVLEKLEMNIDDYGDYEFFDIGAGPATFSLSLLNQNENLSITAIETSAIMKEQGERFVESLFSSQDFKYQNLSETLKEEKVKKRFGIFGHSANEMGIKITLDYIRKLDLDIVLFIEPGTKDFFQSFKDIRNELKNHYHILYPCLSKASCPLAEDDWCHQYLKLTHDPEVERLTQLVSKDRRMSPIGLSLFSKNNFEQVRKDHVLDEDIIIATIIRVYHQTKFSFEWKICYQEHGENKVCDLQIMTRDFKKKRIKELNLVTAGTRIQFIKTKELEHNKLRGKLHE